MSQVATNNELIEAIKSLNENKDLQDLRLRAYKKASALGLPSKEIEGWRKFNASGIDPHALAAGVRLTQAGAGLHIDAPASVKVQSFSEVMETEAIRKDLVAYFEHALEHEADHDVFSALNLALYQHSVYLTIEGVLDKPIRIEHNMGEGTVLAPFVFIVAAEDSESVIHEIFTGKAGEEQTLVIPRTRILLRENSRMKYISNRKYFDSELHFHRFQADQERNSYLETAILHRGGQRGKGFYIDNIHDHGAEFQAYGIGVSKNAEFHDLQMHANHYSSNGISRILYKTVLMDRAHSVFDGNLLIPEGLKNIDALQVNNNILLDPKARAESMPRLVTLSEDVQCEHGATVGDLDPEAIFFLRARGLTEQGARDILIQGFIREVIEKLPLSEDEIEQIDGDILEIVRK